ncbi:collagenase family [Shewanella violacea DSS12]|uniref:Collagenase family n=2 Tax=Shewanella violacea TaxID=60217 RepID=D4ZFC7_SHEVD|nr:collagenase family [Shewanella violacea DSS12]
MVIHDVLSRLYLKIINNPILKGTRMINIKNTSKRVTAYGSALVAVSLFSGAGVAATVNTPPTAESINTLSKPSSHIHQAAMPMSTQAQMAPGDSVLRYQYSCSSAISIRSESYISPENLQAVCDELVTEEARYHLLMKTNQQPLAGDYSQTVEINAFKDYASYQYNAAQIFGIDTNNGGMYLEGDPSIPGNQARYVTYITDDANSWWIMNLSHEFNHYLDGRYNMAGNFETYMSSSNNVVFWLEGSAEYIAWVDWPYDYIGELAASAALSLSDVVNTTYEHDTGRIYQWGYLGVAFIFERHPEALDSILAAFRSGDYASYNSFIQNFAYQNSSEWYEWLTCTASYHDSPNKECWDHTPTDGGGGGDGGIPADASCNAMGPYSGRTSTATSITIENLTSQHLKIRWLQADGSLYSTIYDSDFEPGERWSHSASVGDKWVVTDNSGSCKKLFTAELDGAYSIGDQQAGITDLVKGVAASIPAANAGDEYRFRLSVPAGATDVSFSVSGNNGDADLYVKKGSQPTSKAYDCKSDSSGSVETCIAGNGEGDFYGLVSAYSAFSQAQITADYQLANTGGLTPDASCALEGQAYSRNGTQTQFTINNNSDTNLKIQWLQADGSRYANVYNDSFAPGDSWSRSSYTQDRWVITDQSGQCMKVITVSANASFDMVGDGGGDGGGGGNTLQACAGGIQAYPTSYPNSWYYTRLCTSGTGIPIVSANVASAASIERTAYLLDGVMQTVDSRVVPQMVANGFRHAVMGRYPYELTTQLPEYSHLDSAYWDERARGLGGMPSVPVGSSAEENAMCYSDDRYLGEDITIHEYAHSLHLLGLDYVFPGFSSQLQSAYSNANYYNLWGAGHYAMTDYKEYWAEGVQSFFNSNMGGGPNTRSALQAQDPTLYGIVYGIFGNSPFYRTCP